MPTQRRSRACREERRQEAEERNAAWSALTPKAKLASLDSRLGAGQGARRQREKLKAQA